MRGGFTKSSSPVVVGDIAQDTEDGAVPSALHGIGTCAGKNSLPGKAPQDLREQNGNHVVQDPPAVLVVPLHFLIDLQNRILDLFILSGAEEDPADRVAAVKAAHKKIGENVVIAERIEKDVIKSILADMKVQHKGLIVENRDRLLYIGRQKKQVTAGHRKISAVHRVPAVSAQYVEHCKKRMAVLKDRRVAKMPDNIDIGSACDGKVRIQIFLMEDGRVRDERIIKDQHMMPAHIVLHLIQKDLFGFRIRAKKMVSFIDFFVFCEREKLVYDGIF